MSPSASPARTRRRRGFCSRARAPLASALFGTALAWSTSAHARGAAAASAGDRANPIATPGRGGWSVARRFPGSDRGGELGFRFGEPLDADGDGHADVAAGARFKPGDRRLQNGSATVWSGATGAPIRTWDGTWPDGLFGHWVMPVPDVSGDGLADVVVAAPHGAADGVMRGILTARSPKTGEQIWTRFEKEGENLGWDMALAGDQNGDGAVDLFVGAPGADTGRVYLLSGRDGAALRTYAPERNGGTFGWAVAALDDLDGDGEGDLAVGGPSATDERGVSAGAVWVLSSATGREIRRFAGSDRRGGFGVMVASVADQDGDGKADLAIAAPGTEDPTRQIAGEVRVFSTASGAELRGWSGGQPGELYGRMVVSAGDVDGDGTADVAIGAPAYRSGAGDRVGRVELRSGRTGAVLAELYGDGPDCWFGWHIRRAPDPAGRGRPALLIGSLRHPVGGEAGVGVIDLYVRGASPAPRQGTTTRGARRSDIR